MRLNLAINYGGRTEIVDAVNAMLENARVEGNLESLEVTEDAIRRISTQAVWVIRTCYLDLRRNAFE